MEYKKLGKSDVLVSELILGCWAMGGDYFGATEDKSSLEALEVSYENGVNTFDTAEIYGDGRSERVVGEAARRIGRDKVRIISKVFKPSMSHDKMIKACEDSLQRLGTDYLDVYFLHYPVAEEEVTIQERMETMEELKKAGKIRAIGLSNFSLEEMKAAMKFGQVDVIQPCYSLLWRYDEALLEFSRNQGISVIPYSTLAQGLLTGKYQKGAVFTDGRARAALFQPENYDRCLEVTDVLDKFPAQMSGGQKQRVAIAGVIAMQPKCIVLDEPTSFLDIRYKLELLSVLKRMVRENDLAVLLSLHELDLARRISDTVICVAGDRIDRIGTPEEIFTSDYIAQLYHLERGKYDECFSTLEFVP